MNVQLGTHARSNPARAASPAPTRRAPTSPSRASSGPPPRRSAATRWRAPASPSARRPTPASRCARRRSRTARAPATTRAAARSGSSSSSRPTGALLGGQIVGTEGAAKRIDVLAACIWTGMARRRARAARPLLRPALLGRLRPAPRRGAGARRRPCSYDALRADPLELARAQQHDQLAARAVEAHGGDAALLEVDPPAGEVVDDLGEVGLVADDEHALVGTGGGQELAARRRRRSRRRAPRARSAPRRGPRTASTAVSRARTLGLVKHRWTCDLERRQRAARDPRLLAAAIGEAAVGVGSRVVGLGLAVPQEPELLRHAPGRLPGAAAISACA